MTPNMIWSCPLIRSGSASASLRSGTWIMSTPAIILNSSPATWSGLPVPPDAMLILHGLALA